MLADSVAVRSARVPSTPHEVANLDTSLKYQSIHAIVSAKQFKLLSAHVRAGGDIDEVDTLGQTALHHSCQSGDDVAVYFLLREGANVNAADYRSITPLHLAIQNGFGAISERLLYSGADFALQNEDLLMPFQLRVRRLDPDIGATVGHRQKKPALKKWFSSRAFTRRAKPSRSTSTDKGLRNKSPSTFTVASSAVEYSSDNPQSDTYRDPMRLLSPKSAGSDEVLMLSTTRAARARNLVSAPPPAYEDATLQRYCIVYLSVYRGAIFEATVVQALLRGIPLHAVLRDSSISDASSRHGHTSLILVAQPGPTSQSESTPLLLVPLDRLHSKHHLQFLESNAAQSGGAPVADDAQSEAYGSELASARSGVGFDLFVTPYRGVVQIGVLLFAVFDDPVGTSPISAMHLTIAETRSPTASDPPGMAQCLSDSGFCVDQVVVQPLASEGRGRKEGSAPVTALTLNNTYCHTLPPQDVQIAIRRFFTPPDGKFAPHILEKTIDKVTALGQWMGKQAAVFHRTRVVVTYDEVGEVRVLLVPHGYIQADPSAQRRDGSAPITALVNLMRQCM
eukprot:c10987_g1_i2.p1 GENE.c10987_g1_i2~~c10987_g1_i2.p1  ORF type:complete len:565 (+),score=99.11 c10987_g1_i2:55-1749(+)